MRRRLNKKRRSVLCELVLDNWQMREVILDHDLSFLLLVMGQGCIHTSSVILVPSGLNAVASWSALGIPVAFSEMEQHMRLMNLTAFICGGGTGRIVVGDGTKAEGVWVGACIGVGMDGAVIYLAWVGTITGVVLRVASIVWRWVVVVVRVGWTNAAVAWEFGGGFLIITGTSDHRPPGCCLKVKPGGRWVSFEGGGSILNLVKALLRLLSFWNSLLTTH